MRPCNIEKHGDSSGVDKLGVCVSDRGRAAELALEGVEEGSGEGR